MRYPTSSHSHDQCYITTLRLLHLVDTHRYYYKYKYKKDDLKIAVDRKLSQGRFDKNRVSRLWLSVAFSKQIRFNRDVIETFRSETETFNNASETRPRRDVPKIFRDETETI